MDTPLSNLFFYLEKENIPVDSKEFEFQLKSHPDYPSLLSVSDTLHFFNIENTVARIEFKNLAHLPNRLLALLDTKGNSILQYVEKDNDNFQIKKSKKLKQISKIELEKKWDGICLLVEKYEGDFKIKPIKNNNLWILSFVIILFFITFFQRSENVYSISFFLLPILGIFFSIASLKNLFETNNVLINNFCNITGNSDCSLVIDSDKWKLFKYAKFSDLSLIFFISQFLTLLLSICLKEVSIFLSFQKNILCISMPVIFLSIYYQKFIAKKWCPICLTIAAIVLLEFLLLLNIPFSLYKNYIQITIFSFIFFSNYLFWNELKMILEKKKELIEDKSRSLRFERNYKLFKKELISRDKITLPANVVLGQRNSKHNITIISNPFCGHCKNAHLMLDKILERNKGKLHVNVIIRTDISVLDDNSKKLFRGLLAIYFDKGDECFKKALNDWFAYSDIEKWLSHYNIEDDLTHFDEMFENHFNWSNEAMYNFTPAIFINNYEFPNIYDRNTLEFFIRDIIEDTDFN